MFKKVKEKVQLDIPYFSQWESAELVDDILNKHISAREDPKWKNSSAENLDEYELWAINVCGMTCIKMVLRKELGLEIPLVATAKDSVRYGCYIPKDKEIDGLFYDPAVGFLRDKFGLDVEVYRKLGIKKIKEEITKRNYVIVSVNPEIRDPNKDITKPKGGHLVLVTGFDDIEKTISIHNPSGYFGKSQINFTLLQKTFQKYFAGRGFIILHK